MKMAPSSAKVVSPLIRAATVVSSRARERAALVPVCSSMKQPVP
jgi:hypothetical protein